MDTILLPLKKGGREGFILYYNQDNKRYSQRLRKNQTAAEMLLWSRIRKKQIMNIQFYRQKPIGNFIVDFYAPSVKLVLELDGSQHFEEQHQYLDLKRDLYFQRIDHEVLRFSNLQILHSLNETVENIFAKILSLQNKSPRLTT